MAAAQDFQHHLQAENEDEESEVYSSTNFRIRHLKVMRCSKKYCHDWTKCPFAHPGEKATRRDPMLGIYTGIACPDMKKDQRCPRGPYCPYAHNVFEYWLHPTRYRTALCRDMDKCTRKICFFAHEVHEIRTNVERPYVSPEQLLAAAEAAAADPRVQAEYKAAAEDQQRKSGKPGLMTGLFNSLDGPVDGEASDSSPGSGMSLQAPRPTQENREMMHALSSMIQNDSGSRWNPFSAGAGSLRPTNLSEPPMGLASVPTPPARTGSADRRGRVRRTTSDPLNRAAVRRPAQQELDAAMAPMPQVQSVNTIDEMTPSMFPSHLNTLVRPGQLPAWAMAPPPAGAATNMCDRGPSIWSTPVSTLDQLYSTASTSSDWQSSLDNQATSPGRLEVAFRQKWLARSRGQNPLHSAPSGLPHVGDYAQVLQQQQQAMQAHAYLQQQQQQQQQQQIAYEQEMRARLHEAINAELRQQAAQMAPQQVETGFDLRFGGLGENQGLLAQHNAEHSAARPNLLRSTAALPQELFWPSHGPLGETQGMDSLEDELARMDLGAATHPPPTTTAINA